MHALIAGVSDYPNLPIADPENRGDIAAPHFGLRKLASPAFSAFRLARALSLWAPTLAVPLATIRLLLSPSIEENLANSPTAQRAGRASWDNFAAAASAWRDDVATHRDNMAFFYFGGHGLQRYVQDQIVLMDEFGDGRGAPLRHGVESHRLIRGMVPCDHFPNMGRRQMFLFDACRITPLAKITKDVERVGDIWTVYDTEVDDRDCAILYASSPGESSYSNRGGKTVFCRAFINAVNRFAAESAGSAMAGTKRPWKVSAPSLASSIGALIKDDPTPFKEQNLHPMGGSRDFIFRELRRAPRVKTVFRVEPSIVHKRASLSLRDQDLALVCETGAPIAPYPYQPTLYAGLYSSELEVRPVDGVDPPLVRRELHDISPFERLFVLPTP